MTFRTETDGPGLVKVPTDKLYARRRRARSRTAASARCDPVLDRWAMYSAGGSNKWQKKNN